MSKCNKFGAKKKAEKNNMRKSGRNDRRTWRIRMKFI
jgi:hypothetical protein